jgi:hypothetical protein
MDNQSAHSAASNDPASAFAELRSEVSLLRRAIEGLTSERQNAPDYTPTLKALAGRLTNIEAYLAKVSDSPAMRFTPENLAASIAQASETVRAGDCDTIRQASEGLRTSIASIYAVVDQAWTADRQFKNLLWAIAGGTVAGVSLCAVVVHVLF